MRILVVEDEPKVAFFIKSGLEQHGHEVQLAYDGFTGEKLAKTREYDVMLVDVIIPAINGVELCRRIKTSKPDTPVLMLTALDTTPDKVRGFNAGADDYLVKPFDFAELIARISALTRRKSLSSQPAQSPHLAVADLRLDVRKKVALRGDRSIPLTAKEYDLLEYFMINKGRVLSKSELAEKVWDITFDRGTNVVEVYINILRKKIDRDFNQKLIHTRIGMGYMLAEDP